MAICGIRMRTAILADQMQKEMETGSPGNLIWVKNEVGGIVNPSRTPCLFMALTFVLLFFGACKQDIKPEHVKSEVNKASKVPVPAWTDRAVFAEVNLRDYNDDAFGPSGLAKDISIISDMGINALILSPVFPRGMTFETNNIVTCESIKDYRATDPSLGTFAEFRSIIAQCHESGVRVIMDWPVNKAGFDNVWIDQHQLWFKRTDNNRFVRRTSDQDNCLASFDYYNNAMRQAMIETMLYWVDECQVDGFRFDYDAAVSSSFWEELHTQFANKGKIVFLMGKSGVKASYPSTYLHAREGGDVNDILNSLTQKEKDGSPIIRLPGSDENILRENGLFYFRLSERTQDSDQPGAALSDEDVVNALLVLTYTGMPVISHGVMQSLIEGKAKAAPEVEKIASFIDLKKQNLALINDSYLQNTSLIESISDRVHYKREVGIHRVDVLANLSAREYIHKFSAEYKGKNWLTGELEHWYPQVDSELMPYGFSVLVKR